MHALLPTPPRLWQQNEYIGMYFRFNVDRLRLSTQGHFRFVMAMCGTETSEIAPSKSMEGAVTSGE